MCPSKAEAPFPYFFLYPKLYPIQLKKWTNQTHAIFLQNPLSSTAPLNRRGVWHTQGTKSTLENVILRGRLKNRAYNRKPLAATATAIPHGVHSAFPFKDQAPQVQCSAKEVKCPSSFQKLIWGSCALPMFTMPVLRRILKRSSARAECPPQIKAGI